jgi:proline iminopeptidase
LRIEQTTRPMAISLCCRPTTATRKIAHIWDGNKFATPHLLPDLVTPDLAKINKLAIPLILFEGRRDRNVNSEVAAAWFSNVTAPEKHLVWFEHSGHMPMTEEPGKFLFSVRSTNCGASG